MGATVTEKRTKRTTVEKRNVEGKLAFSWTTSLGITSIKIEQARTVIGIEIIVL